MLETGPSATFEISLVTGQNQNGEAVYKTGYFADAAGMSDFYERNKIIKGNKKEKIKKNKKKKEFEESRHIMHNGRYVTPATSKKRLIRRKMGNASLLKMTPEQMEKELNKNSDDE